MKEMSNKRPPLSTVALTTFGVITTLALIFAIPAAFSSANAFFGVFEIVWIPLALVSSIVVIWIGVIEPAIRPTIYVMKEKGLFVYSKANQRVAFTHLEVFDSKNISSSSAVDDPAYFNEVNGLFLCKSKKVDESGSYLVFDKNYEAVAVLPYQKSYGAGKRSIAVIDSNKNEKWISIEEFIQMQESLLHS